MKETFMINLQQAMKNKGYRQVDLCNKTGIDKSLLNGYLNGSCMPKHERLKLLANALDVSESWLIGFDEKQQIVMETNNSILELLECYTKLHPEQQAIILDLLKNMNK